MYRLNPYETLAIRISKRYLLVEEGAPRLEPYSLSWAACFFKKQSLPAVYNTGGYGMSL